MPRDYLDLGDDTSFEKSEQNVEEKFVNNIITANSETEERMWVKQYLKVFPGQQERLKQLLYATEKVKNKTVETLKHAGNRMQEEGEKIVDNAVKVSDQVNDKVFEGLNKAADKILEKGAEVVDKVNEQFEIAYENASGYELEYNLAQNFDEDFFVKCVLERKISFTMRTRVKYDFVTRIGTYHILTSEHGIFKFEMLVKDSGGRREDVFKINNIDSTTHLSLTKKGIVLNIRRLHNVIMNGEDKGRSVNDITL